MGGKFKFQVQDSDLEYLFWRFDKHIALSEKKLPLVTKSVVPLMQYPPNAGTFCTYLNLFQNHLVFVKNECFSKTNSIQL